MYDHKPLRTIFCGHCGEEKRVVRSDAKYCSATCQKNAYRQARRIPVRAEYETMADLIAHIQKRHERFVGAIGPPLNTGC